VTVQASGGSGGAGGGGAGAGGGLTNAQLLSLISAHNASLIGPATLKGNKLTVRTRCPAKVGRTCRIAVQGLLSRHKAATSKRKVTVRKDKTKRAVLRVKPKALTKLAKKRKLLFKETVRAGKAHATVYKRLKLIRR
jgi:hypothetical protein